MDSRGRRCHFARNFLTRIPIERRERKTLGLTQERASQNACIITTEGDVPDTVISDLTDRILEELEIRGRSDFTDRKPQRIHYAE